MKRLNILLAAVMLLAGFFHAEANAWENLDAAIARRGSVRIGIGYNTPGIIRLPFEQFAQKFPHTTLVRFNPGDPDPYLQDLPRFVPFTEDINQILNDISTP